jgi:hypothetical protein
MAKIHEEIIIIKFSRLAKDSDSLQPAVNSDLSTALVQVAEELVGPGVVVELITEQQ